MSTQPNQKQKFTLPAGITNRHQWHKEAAHALSVLSNVQFQRRELYGTKGGEERESIISTMFAGVENEKAAELFQDIGDRFGWMITKENAAEIVDAVRVALPEAREAMPVDDHRETPEQKADRIQASNDRAAEREREAAQKAQEVDTLAAELRKLYPWAMADDGKLSGAARAAKNLKKELQLAFPGVKFSVTSEYFSMGNSIRVNWTDGPSQRTVDAITGKYAYYIDKCTDDNSAKAKAVGQVLGQSKYVTTSRDISEHLKAQVRHDIEARADVSEMDFSRLTWSALSTVDIFGEYDGVELDNRGEYLAKFKEPEQPAQTNPQAASVGGLSAHIEEHTHTKKGFLMYLVVLDDRVERDEFLDLKNQAEIAGGWYSRKWGRTPGGFAFKDSNKAAEFLASITGDGAPVPPTGNDEPPKSRPGNGDRLRKLADDMQSKIEDKLRDRQTNTPKRLAQANHARLEGEHMQRAQQLLYKLADLHDAGNVSHDLKHISTKADALEVTRTRTEMVPNGFHTYHRDTGEPVHNTPRAVAAWALLEGKSDEDKAADVLRAKVEGLQFSQIPGYFPTPAPIVTKMLDRADLRDYFRVLEPSAGSGAICDAVAPVLDNGELVTYEVNHTLREILELKGYDLAGDDFTQAIPSGDFDLVLMNPPFEKLQDIDHVRHAFGFLKPGGRLVAIMSASVTFNSQRKAVEFRDWVNSLGGEIEDIPAGAFKDSGTGIASVLLTLDK